MAHMVQIVSKRLGAIELDEAAILHFPMGLPGFEHCQRFAILEQPPVAPIVFLQSLDLPDVCFLAAPIAAIDPAYELAVSPDDLRSIGRDTADDVVCLAILAPAENGQFTANLLAPVVIDRKTRRAIQAVRVDSRYSHQHLLARVETSCS
jgi:flagellar assembly factor FliW